MFGLVFPIYYLIALRSVLWELHKKDKSDERPVEYQFAGAAADCGFSSAFAVDGRGIVAQLLSSLGLLAPIIQQLHSFASNNFAVLLINEFKNQGQLGFHIDRTARCNRHHWYSGGDVARRFAGRH